METSAFTIAVESNDEDFSLDQTLFMKSYLEEQSPPGQEFRAEQLRAKLNVDEAGGALEPILSIILAAPVVREFARILVTYIKSREAIQKTKVSQLKVKIKNSQGQELELDATNLSEDDSALAERIAKMIKK